MIMETSSYQQTPVILTESRWVQSNSNTYCKSNKQRQQRPGICYDFNDPIKIHTHVHTHTHLIMRTDRSGAVICIIPHYKKGDWLTSVPFFIEFPCLTISTTVIASFLPTKVIIKWLISLERKISVWVWHKITRLNGHKSMTLMTLMYLVSIDNTQGFRQERDFISPLALSREGKMND